MAKKKSATAKKAASKKTTAKKNAAPQFAIGVDYGTNSCRALIVNCADGNEIATSVFHYPSGKAGILLDPKDPHLARQNPADYIKGFNTSIKQAVEIASKKSGFKPEYVIGIGVDTTGSTPIPVDQDGVALATKPEFKKNLAAHAWLWKDHTSHVEAAEITQKAIDQSQPYLAKCGGTYSSEWFWAKVLKCKRSAPKVFKAAYSWVELADFVPAYATGNTNPDKTAENAIVRGICAAGHKAMFHEDWGGLPSKAFLTTLDPALAKLRDRLYDVAVASDQEAGKLNAKVAKKIGLPAGIPVAAGAFDAHHGGVGAGIKPGTLVKTIGTSTCDLMTAPGDVELPDIPGLCGIVPGSIIPGEYGMEAGQSAVGDIFNWFVSNLVPAKYTEKGDVHVNLTKEAAKMAPGENGLICLDWNNGNRTILVDPLLAGVTVGTTLHTTAPEMYRALIEATAFGALTIINRWEEYGVKVKEVINCGGIAEKNDTAMQIYADICNRPMKISRSAQTCALGAAIFGAIVGGAYKNVAQAQKKMTGVKPKVFKPIRKNVKVYAQMYSLYKRLHDALGTASYEGELQAVLKDIIAIRDQARQSS